MLQVRGGKISVQSNFINYVKSFKIQIVERIARKLLLFY